MEQYKFDPSTFDCVSNGVGSRWIKWKRAFEIYANARKISDQKQKCSMLLHCGGMQLQDIYFTLKGDLSKYDDAEKALTQYFQPSINVPFERHVFKGPFSLRAWKKSFFVCFIDFFCARFNFNRSLQSKINKREKECFFHARSGNGPSECESKRDQTIEQFITRLKARFHYERGKEHSLFVLLIFF